MRLSVHLLHCCEQLAHAFHVSIRSTNKLIQLKQAVEIDRDKHRSSSSDRARAFRFRNMLWAIVALTPGSVLAQYTPDPTNAVGSSPLATYKVGDIDNVNPVNGNLFVNIPLLSYPQLGHVLRLNFHIYSNDKHWFINNYRETQNAGGTTIVSGSWGLPTTGPGPGVYIGRDQSLSFGWDVANSSSGGGSNASAYTITTQVDHFFIENADGAKHYYGEYQAQGCQAISGSCPTGSSNNETNFYPTSDATGYLPGSSGLLGASQVTDNQGVLYSVGSNNLETITDPSGNTITATANGWVDSLSRSIPGTVTGVSLGGSLGDTSQSLTYQSVDLTPGVPAAVASTNCPTGTTVARSWIVPAVYGGAETYYLCYKPFSFSTGFNLNQMVFPFWSYQVEDIASSATLLSAIVLPNNTSYTFTYDSYLSLSQMTLPTGAIVNYTWQNLLFIDGPGTATPYSRALASRTVIPGNGQPTQTWRYQFIGTPFPGTSTIENPTWSITTDPAGNDEEDLIAGTDDSGAAAKGVVIRQMFYAGCGPHDTSNPTCNTSSSTLLKTISNTFQPYASGGSGLPNGGPLEPTTTKTTLNIGDGSTRVSQIVRTMTPRYGSCTFWADLGNSGSQPLQATDSPCYSTNQVHSEAVYDYGNGAPGSVLRTTTTNYEWQTPNSPYLVSNMLTIPQSVVISGSATAETDYGYDAQGNQTSVTKVLNTGASPITQTSYNSQGMPTSTIDANNHATGFTYDNTGAFLSKVTYPSTSNGVQHTEGYSFDRNTGLMLTHTDQNQQMTTYSYRDPSTQVPDPLNRLREIIYPATVDGTTGGSASGNRLYTYVDTAGSLSVTEADLQRSSGTTETHVTSFDGLGRTIQQIDPSGAVVDTSYDGLGHIHTVSNPHFTSSSASDGTTMFAYDALGRKTVQTQPDGSLQQWCYGDVPSGQSSFVCLPNSSSMTGSWIDYSDETNRHYQRVSDALGRLTAVMEPVNNLPALETDYSYDALGNLRWVNQKGTSVETPRTRNFIYDSLSRLTSATNPETGTIGYGYDANGNMISKTDARGIATSYGYDVLNRMINEKFCRGQRSARFRLRLLV